MRRKKKNIFPLPKKKHFGSSLVSYLCCPPRDEAGDEGGTPSLQWGGSRGDAQRCGAGGTGPGA